MLRIHVAKGCAPTARVLAKLLSENGVDLGGPTRAHLCWGVGGAQAPALNSKCSAFNKFQQLITMAKAGVLTVPASLGMPAALPALARKFRHKAGRDIIMCRTSADARRALRKGRGYFTQFIPSDTEFRVWIYRRRHLGTYEKVLTQPWKNRRHRIGRNHRNGYGFQIVAEANIPREAVDMAVKAVDVLGLDFGAVDILKGRDGGYYVLECNTAPGIEGPGRQVIQALARKIAKWTKLGFPKRNGEGE